MTLTCVIVSMLVFLPRKLAGLYVMFTCVCASIYYWHRHACLCHVSGERAITHCSGKMASAWLLTWLGCSAVGCGERGVGENVFRLLIWRGVWVDMEDEKLVIKPLPQALLYLHQWLLCFHWAWVEVVNCVPQWLGTGSTADFRDADQCLQLCDCLLSPFSRCLACPYPISFDAPPPFFYLLHSLRFSFHWFYCLLFLPLWPEE